MTVRFIAELLYRLALLATPIINVRYSTRRLPIAHVWDVPVEFRQVALPLPESCIVTTAYQED